MTSKDSDAREPNRRLRRAGVPGASATSCIKALGAPQRRRILRTLHEVGEARSPNELAKAFGSSVGHLSYHVKVLKECGVVALTDTRQKRGAVEHFYASTVIGNEPVVQLLEATKADDDTDNRSA